MNCCDSASLLPIPHRPSRREDTKIAQGETLGKLAVAIFPPRRGGVKIDRKDYLVNRAIVRSAPPGRIFLFLHPPQGFVRRGGLHPGLFSLAPYGSFGKSTVHGIARVRAGFWPHPSPAGCRIAVGK